MKKGLNLEAVKHKLNIAAMKRVMGGSGPLFNGYYKCCEVLRPTKCTHCMWAHSGVPYCELSSIRYEPRPC